MAGLRLDVRPGREHPRSRRCRRQRPRPTPQRRRRADPHAAGRPTARAGEDRTDPQMDRRRRRLAGRISAPQTADPAKHWAFVPPVRPAVPRTSRPDWVRNPIDAFVLARLDQASLKPSPEADRATLLRRLSLDLIGLPPTLAELDAFLADRSPDAYEKQVDRLLASPHYGERWGRIWLDAARYADSNGYEKDAPRFVWFYRDWVINALNRDLPYNQFVIEQIAGDLLPNATQDQMVATGFLRNSMINEEGGVDPEQFRMEAMFDRMDAIGKGHSRRHHPVRAVPQSQVRSAHAGRVLPHVRVPQQHARGERGGLHARAAGEARGDLPRARRRSKPDCSTATRTGRSAWRRGKSRCERTSPNGACCSLTVDDISTGGERELPMKDGSMLAQGYAPTKHTVEFTAKTDVPRIAAVRLELLTDPNLPNGGPGRSIKGRARSPSSRWRPRPPRRRTSSPSSRSRRRRPTSICPKRRWKPKFDDKSGKRRVTGPDRIRHRRQGRDRLGHRCRSGPAQPAAQGRLPVRRRRWRTPRARSFAFD